MKKALSLLLLILFLFTLSSAAFAEDDLSWDFYGPIAQETFGDTAHLVTLHEVNATIWVPDFLKSVPLTEEDLSAGAIASYMPEDESEMVYIAYYDAEGLSLDGFQRSLSNSGVKAEIQTINGIPALVYYDGNNDTFVVTYATAEGYFLQIMCFPFSDELSSVLFAMMLSSVQPIVEEVEENAPVVVPQNPVSGLISK